MCEDQDIESQRSYGRTVKVMATHSSLCPTLHFHHLAAGLTVGIQEACALTVTLNGSASALPSSFTSSGEPSPQVSGDAGPCVLLAHCADRCC